MKMKTNSKIILSLLFFLGFNYNMFSQKIIANYEPLALFEEFVKPVTIGIICPIEDGGFEENFLNELEKSSIVRENFIFYPSKTLNSFKEDLSISELSIDNLQTLIKLKENFGIEFILSGRKLYENQFHIQIQIIRTDDGVIVFNNEYKNSINSTPIYDVMRLFAHSQKTIYKNIINHLPELVIIKKGQIEVTDGLKRDTISVDRDYYISKYYCTISQFTEFVESNGFLTDAEKNKSQRLWSKSTSSTKGRQKIHNEIGYDSINAKDEIVTNISWNDANAYCEWLSNETGEKYRLASKNEIRFAASLIDYGSHINDLDDTLNSALKVVSGSEFFIEGISEWVYSEWNEMNSLKLTLRQIFVIAKLNDIESFLKYKIENKKANYINPNVSFRIVKEIF